MQRWFRYWRLWHLALIWGAWGAHAAWAAPAVVDQPLPSAVQSILQRAKVPAQDVHLYIADTDSNRIFLQHEAQAPINPASLMKLVTTSASLDLLGSAYTWHTPLFVEGQVVRGTLTGNVYIKGAGDPHWVVERLWLFLRRLQGLGIQNIQGDIVLDHSAFAITPRNAADFDGEPLRPYNASPDALLINFKSLLIHFSPDRAANVAHIHVEPALSDVKVPSTVPLANGDCSDYRSALKADWNDPTQIRFNGSFPAVCGDKIWPIAYNAPAQYAARTLAGMWRALGGQLSGQVRDGQVPPSLKPMFDSESEALAEVIRDINKYSNNVMAQQLFLTLSLEQNGVGTFEGSRSIVQRWWRERINTTPPILENGSGLSREERISAQGLGQLLQWMWRAPTMSELMSSLPVSGSDGTLKRSKAQASAHLKTGSLRDVAGVAGYVDGPNGQRRILIAIINHPNASAARPIFDALIDWTAQQP